MDINQYNRIFQFLSQQKLPSDLTTSKQIKQFKNFCIPFIIKNNYIYRKDKRKEEHLLRVIRTFEMEPVLYMMHNSPTAGHFSVDIMFEKIRSRYYWPQMYENIREYVKSCDACQRRGKAKTRQELHPIPTHSPFYQIGIDFVGPLPRTNRGNRYIIVAMDYFTKWPEARPVPTNTSKDAEQFIYEEIICQHGCPQIILSDRGTHFKNELLEKLTARFEIKHLFSTPYHPQTNGLVERFNRTLCESLAKLSQQTKQWDEYVRPVLFAYRTSKQATTKMTPFYLTYGRKARLPVDGPEQSEEHLSERIFKLIDQLPHDRDTTRKRIAMQQNKQKAHHDQQVKGETKFTIGDKVLLYKAEKEKQWTGKLEEKWKGPFYIHLVQPHGSYKLRTLEGQVLKTPFNGRLLKHYYDRQQWIPQIVLT